MCLFALASALFYLVTLCRPVLSCSSHWSKDEIREIARAERKKAAAESAINFGTQNDVSDANTNIGFINLEWDSFAGGISIGAVCLAIVGACFLYYYCRLRAKKANSTTQRSLAAAFRRKGSHSEVAVRSDSSAVPAPVVSEQPPAIAAVHATSVAPAVGHQGVPTTLPAPIAGASWIRTPLGFQSVPNQYLPAHEDLAASGFAYHPDYAIPDLSGRSARFTKCGLPGCRTTRCTTPYLDDLINKYDFGRFEEAWPASEAAPVTRRHARSRDSRGLPQPTVQPSTDDDEFPEEPAASTGAIPKRFKTGTQPRKPKGH